jgi:hypothetical protein
MSCEVFHVWDFHTSSTYIQGFGAYLVVASFSFKWSATVPLEMLHCCMWVGRINK